MKKLISKRRETTRTAALVIGGLWLSASSTILFAADFSVNEPSDAVDNAPGNGACEIAGGGCTLRAAIMEANALPGADTIAVPAGDYVLDITGVDERCDDAGTIPAPCSIDGTTGNYVPVITSDASKGDLDITDDVTITGEGSDVTTVKWAPTSPGVPLEGDNDPLSGDRIFHAAVKLDATEDIASVVIQGLTVVNGEVGLKPTTAYDVCVADGEPPTTTHYDDTKLNAYDIAVIDSTCGPLDADGKFVVEEPPLTSIIINQFRRMGGGIAVGGGYSVVVYNSTTVGTPPDVITGGENQVAGVESASLNDVVVINNWSGSDGGGVFAPVSATISQSKISGNTSAGGNGGGLYSERNTTVSDTLIGKVFDAVTAGDHPELTNGNSAENGGAIFFTGAPGTTLTILRSAINGNEAIGGAGIAAREAPVSLTNTTVSGNIARDVGAGIITSGDVFLQNVTVADNLANSPAPVGGAGLDSFGDGTFYMSNTLLSNNKVQDIDDPSKVRLANCGCQGGDCTGLMVSQGYNLEDGDTCQFDVAFHHDQVDTDPLLLELAANGGLTETHLIPHSAIGGGVDSPAVDAGNNVNCPNNDQRTYYRPADGNGDGVKDCDIGAFELSNIDPDLQIANMVAPDSVTRGNDYNVTVTITNGAVNPHTSVTLVTDALPSIVTFVSATTTAGTCAEAAGVVTCDIGDLDGTSSVMVTLTLTASAVGDATITTNVTSTEEPDASLEPNNTASVLTMIKSSSDSNGCSCSFSPDGSIDPLLPGLLLASLIYLGWRTRKTDIE